MQRTIAYIRKGEAIHFTFNSDESLRIKENEKGQKLILFESIKLLKYQEQENRNKERLFILAEIPRTTKQNGGLSCMFFSESHRVKWKGYYIHFSVKNTD